MSTGTAFRPGAGGRRGLHTADMTACGGPVAAEIAGRGRLGEPGRQPLSGPTHRTADRLAIAALDDDLAHFPDRGPVEGFVALFAGGVVHASGPRRPAGRDERVAMVAPGGMSPQVSGARSGIATGAPDLRFPDRAGDRVDEPVAVP
jgi:hypothetical protein